MYGHFLKILAIFSQQMNSLLSGTIKSYEEAPVRVDINTTVNDPFDLEKWLDDNAGTIEVEGSLDLFGAVVNGATVSQWTIFIAPFCDDTNNPYCS